MTGVCCVFSEASSAEEEEWERDGLSGADEGGISLGGSCETGCRVAKKGSSPGREKRRDCALNLSLMFVLCVSFCSTEMRLRKSLAYGWNMSLTESFAVSA